MIGATVGFAPKTKNEEFQICSNPSNYLIPLGYFVVKAC